MSRWWVWTAGNTYGPVETQTLIDSLRNGRILPSDLACREDGRDWLLVSAVPDVALAFAPRPSVQPVAAQDPWADPVWMVGNLDGEILAGPMSLATVNDEVAKRQLTGDELLARVGNASWRPIADVAREHQQALSSRPPAVVPLPAPGPTPLARTQVSLGPAPERPAPAPTRSFPPARASIVPPLPPRRPPPPTRSSTARPAPAAVSDGIEWWLARGGPIEGPFGTAQVRTALATGALDAQTPICRGDRQEWRAASSFVELEAPRTSVPPPLPTRR